MFRYRLRTLLILLAAGPPLLAGIWLLRNDAELLISLAIIGACPLILVLGALLPKHIDGSNAE